MLLPSLGRAGSGESGRDPAVGEPGLDVATNEHHAPPDPDERDLPGLYQPVKHALPKTQESRGGLDAHKERGGG